MNDRALRVETSLALHAAVAERLKVDPEVLDRARCKVEDWLARGGSSTELLQRWREILGSPAETIQQALTERSEAADWLRKASPFAGALPPRERERILREVRRRIESTA